MKKRIRAFLLAALMIVVSITAALGDITTAKADELVLKIHYHRADGDYSAWDVWLWEEGSGGEAFTFDDVDEQGNGVATKKVTAGTSSVGYIVRSAGCWDAKDVQEDQFIDLSVVVSGTVDFYIESGVAGGELVTDGAQVGTKVTNAKYDANIQAVEVKMSGAVENFESAFALTGPNGAITISEVTETGTKYTLKVAEEMDAANSYKLVFDGTEYEVKVPNTYSTDAFEEAYTYSGDDLGATWTKDATTFRVWAPTAASVKVNLYEQGAVSEGDDPYQVVDMTSDVNGTWVATVDGDLNGVFYTYGVNVNGADVEAGDPYARSAGVNGDRSMVIDLASTNPEGWDKDTNPNADLAYTDAIIYELQVRDLGADKSSGIEKPGKFLSLTEHGTTTESGIATGIDHIKELGITHLHLLPIYDFGSVVEDSQRAGYNWGYDPKNYNVPEGSYATDAYDGSVRVSEMKQMVQSLHNDGISVVMDVVYNHVYSADTFSFNVIVPGYFSRVDENGVYSSGSGCGNDTASERAMVKKYIVDSVLYWTEEYHVDGFRFDLVGLLDTETMNAVIDAVHEVRPDVLFYGEGWSMSTTLTKDGYQMATQTNSKQVPKLAFFSDNMRDLLKGSVFSDVDNGYITGKEDLEAELKSCWLGAAGTWCKTPSQQVNYASCHDNMTLFDRITNVEKDEDLATRAKRNNLAAAVYLTAEGIPFMQAGEEMLRTKVNADGTYNTNSYNAGDLVNSLKWDTLDDETYMSVFNYYKGLIAFRKAHAGLRLQTAAEVEKYVSVMNNLNEKLTGFEVSGDATNEESDGIIVVFNPTTDAIDVELPSGDWGICISDTYAGTDVREIVSGTVSAQPLSALVLVKNPDPNSVVPVEGAQTVEAGTHLTTAAIVGIVIGCVVLLGVIIAVIIVLIRKKKKTN